MRNKMSVDEVDFDAQLSRLPRRRKGSVIECLRKREEMIDIVECYY